MTKMLKCCVVITAVGENGSCASVINASRSSPSTSRANVLVSPCCPLLQGQARLKQRAAGYREAAAFLCRTAEELEQFLLRHITEGWQLASH